MINVMMVVHRHWCEKKNPPFWPRMHDALKAHPEINILLTGPRWPGYDNNIHLKQNINRLMPDADVVFLWRPFGIVEFGGIKGGEESLDQLKVSAYQDDPKSNCREAVQANLDLLFYHDLWDRQFFDNCGIRSVYLPLAIHLPQFEKWTTPQSQRKTPVIMAGNLNPRVYPLRGKFEKMIRQKTLPGRIKNNMVYRYRDLRAIRKEQQTYANLLCNSQISLVSTALPQFGPLLFRKYLEAMAAGCVIVADLPAAPPKDVAGRIVQVSVKMSEREIRDRVVELLDNSRLREEHKLANRKVIENGYTYTHLADRWVTAVKESLESR